jgi:hypothetical protein
MHYPKGKSKQRGNETKWQHQDIEPRIHRKSQAILAVFQYRLWSWPTSRTNFLWGFTNRDSNESSSDGYVKDQDSSSDVGHIILGKERLVEYRVDLKCILIVIFLTTHITLYFISIGCRSRLLAPSCTVCLLCKDRSTIMCELTSSIRTRNLNDEDRDLGIIDLNPQHTAKSSISNRWQKESCFFAYDNSFPKKRWVHTR